MPPHGGLPELDVKVADNGVHERVDLVAEAVPVR